MIDKRAKTQWEKSNISFQNFQQYIRKKENKFHLTLIDLLYISNFKGGNATINEPEKEIEYKLEKYSFILQEIDKKFKYKKLQNINDEELQELFYLIQKICSLADKNSNVKIDGFSVSYLSALLNAYFVDLIPILDRRILINLNLVSDENITKEGQIKKIINFYEVLIYKMRKLSKETNKDIREIDKNYFIKKL